MDTVTRKRTEPPKRALTKPSIISIILFTISVIVYAPQISPFFTNAASVQAFLAVFLLPIAFLGLLFSYYTGLSFAKMQHLKIRSGNLFPAYLMLAGLQIFCIGGSIAFEVLLAGYPFEACFDTCQYMETSAVILACFVASAVMFLPAYYAIFRYYTWVVKYMTPKSK